MKTMSPYRTHKFEGLGCLRNAGLDDLRLRVVLLTRGLLRGGIPPRRRATIAWCMADPTTMQESRRLRQTIDTIACWHGRQGGDPRGEHSKRSIFDVRL